MPRPRILIFTLVILLLAATGWFLWRPSDAGEAEAKNNVPELAAEPGDATHVEMANETVARAGIAIAVAGPATLRDRLTLNGRIGANEDQLVHLQPRFAGIVRSIDKRLGDKVAKGDLVATIESNQSLSTYQVRAPLAGTIIEKDVALGQNIGDQVTMFVVANLADVWVDFSVYRQDFLRVHVGQPVTITLGGGLGSAQSTISYLSPIGANDTQTMLARAVVGNAGGTLRPGLFVTGEVALDEVQVPLTVETKALQTIDGNPAIFVREGNRFELRKITTGRSDRERTEILSGLKAGESYATANSFVIKAELGKSSVEEE
ncbi:MAG TPA: efflux RND transporter periplasmic adaptor subunit [Alphaproteobacteria bacterium]|nr:efflux RND transporter periplasmic adaptor subunit [Alphaproteobacteria bacterium]